MLPSLPSASSTMALAEHARLKELMRSPQLASQARLKELMRSPQLASQAYAVNMGYARSEASATHMMNAHTSVSINAANSADAILMLPY